jgi:hypothetical protein
MIPLKRLRNASYDQGIESLADRLVGGLRRAGRKNLPYRKILDGDVSA